METSVNSIADILKPKELKYYKERAEYYQVTSKLNDMFGFINFYVKLSNPDKRLPDEEVDRQARILIPKLDREAQDITKVYESVLKQLEAGTADPHLTKKDWLDYVDRGKNLAETLSKVSGGLQSDNRLDKVLAIEKLISTQHRTSPTVLPQIFDIEPETAFQNPVKKVLDFLFMSEKDKKEYLLKRSQSPQFQQEKEQEKKPEFTTTGKNTQSIIDAVQAARTPQARIADASIRAMKVVPFGRVEEWKLHPNRMDISGVDMPHGMRIAKKHRKRQRARTAPRISSIRG